MTELGPVACTTGPFLVRGCRVSTFAAPARLPSAAPVRLLCA